MDLTRREAAREYLRFKRELKNAWDSFHRQAYRQTLIHCRISLAHMVAALVLLEGEDPGEDPLDRFFDLHGEQIPLDKAEGFTAILYPPELKSLGPVGRSNLSSSAGDWLVSRKISRSRAFEQLTLAQETANLAIRLTERKHPSFLAEVG